MIFCRIEFRTPHKAIMDKKKIALEEIKWIASRLTEKEREKMKSQFIELEKERQKRLENGSESSERKSVATENKDALNQK